MSGRTVHADAEFDSIGVIDALERERLSYLIRKSSDDRVDRFITEMGHDVAVKQSHKMEKNNPGRLCNGHPDPGRGSLD